MTAPKAEAIDPFRIAADALVAEWMRGCAEPVCALEDELRLRTMITKALAGAATSASASA